MPRLYTVKSYEPVSSTSGDSLNLATVQDVFNVRDFGAKGNGVTDDTSAIAQARSEANSAGGGIVFYPQGTYISGNQTLYAKVFDVGAGKSATIIKLKNGTNDDLFSGQTSSINLSATGGSGIQGTLYNFGFMSMTLDGNKANQTGGPSYPLRFYGYSYILRDLEVKNGYSGNILSDWNAGNTFGTVDSMESQWVNVKTHDSNGHGIEFGGPHDSQFLNVIPFNEGYSCLHLGYNSYGSQFSHLHAWSPGQNDGLTLYGQDDFGRGNQSGLGTASDGHSWVEAPASSNVTAAIASNQASFTGNGAESDSYFILGSSTPAAIDITERLNLGGDSGNNTVGIAFRYTDVNNLYQVVVAGNLLYLQKKVGGTKTTINSQAFTLANNTNAWMRVQANGTTLRAKIWLEGNAEPSTWTISQTDSAFSSGNIGIMAWINSGTATADSFVATSVLATPLSPAVLNEAQGAVYFANCQAESSRSVQLVVLGSGFEWVGGNVFGATPYVSTGLQVGQQAGATPYTGQLRQSTGVTTAYAPTNCRISSRVTNTQGPEGALWLANDGAGNTYELTVDMGKGNGFIGTLNAAAHAYIIPYGLTADGSRGKGGYFKFAGNSFNALEIGDGTNVQYNVNTNASEHRWGNGAYVRLYSDNFSTPIIELGSGNTGTITLGNDSTTQIKHLATGITAVTGAFASLQSGTTPDPGAGGTVNTAGIGIARVTPASSRTACILQSGTQPGQEVWVVNNSASFTISWATQATSHISGEAGGTFVLAAKGAQKFVWDSVASLWYKSA